MTQASQQLIATREAAARAEAAHKKQLETDAAAGIALPPARFLLQDPRRYVGLLVEAGPEQGFQPVEAKIHIF